MSVDTAPGRFSFADKKGIPLQNESNLVGTSVTARRVLHSSIMLRRGLLWLVVTVLSAPVVGCGSAETPGSTTDAGTGPGADGAMAGPDATPGTDGGGIPRPDSGPDWMPPTCDGAEPPTSFCDAATWGGTTPSASADLTLAAGTHALLDCVAEARTLTIEAGACVTASRTQSSQLTMHGNLVVEGVLDLGRPDDRVPEGVTAEIVFTGMDDADYQGQPSTIFGTERGPSVDEPAVVLDSDVGLWIMGDGVLTAAGAEKKAWSFLLEGAGPADATIEVENASGWRVGDRVALTPTAMRSEPDHHSQFDEATITAIEGNVITLGGALAFAHDGCTDCMRRGEAANLTRNVVVRSADDEAHAHVLIADNGVLQLDSVELRWLGPEWPGPDRCGGPERRHSVHFHQQHDAADRSFLRHVSIWGGESSFVSVEKSNGVEIWDVAGYDGLGRGFALYYDNSACGTRCTDRDSAPSGILMTEVLAAKIGVRQREEGCARISHRHTAFVVSGGEGSGCHGCVVTGSGWNGSGADMSAFHWAEGGSGRPLDFTFDDNVAHNNKGHGAHVWHNSTQAQEPYRRNRFWSNDDYGILWGAYGTLYRLEDFVSVDNGNASIGVKAVPGDDAVRLSDATIDQVRVLAYVLVQRVPNVLRNLTFSGERDVAFTQLHDTCSGGDETDPEDGDCTRIWLRIENPVFPAGVSPFDFGWTPNLHAVWEVRGFSHPDAEYADLPADFDLYRRDNEVAGGSYDARFDAWVVPR